MYYLCNVKTKDNMCNNSNLNRTKAKPNDELYTCMDDIEKELANYTFKGRSVHCNCDDYRYSNFGKYFTERFKELGLTKLTLTSFNPIGRGFYMVYDGVTMTTGELVGNGDFRSHECMKISTMSDIVVTNPPFSLFRDFIDKMYEYGISFIAVGPECATAYKNVFPHIKANELFIGKNMIKKFIKPDGTVQKFGNIVWWTTTDFTRGRRIPVDSVEYKSYHRYDNYKAIDVPSVKAIPLNRKGVMGVPCTYLKYHDPRKYKIVGLSSSSVENAGEYFKGGTTKAKIKGKDKYCRLFIKKAV